MYPRSLAVSDLAVESKSTALEGWVWGSVRSKSYASDEAMMPALVGSRKLEGRSADETMGVVGDADVRVFFVFL
eukprot:2007806-Rhodomonas_salina.1